MKFSLICIISIFIFLLLVLETSHVKMNIKPLQFILVVFYVSAITFRGIYSDTSVYVNAYQFISRFNFSKGYGYFEVGYNYFSVIIKSLFGNDYRFLFAIIAILNILLVYIVIYIIEKNIYHNENKLKIALLLTMFIPYFGFFYSGLVLRQSIAIGIAYLGFVFLLLEKKILFFLCILLASTFHSSAIILLLIYLVVRIKSFERETYLMGVIVYLVLPLTWFLSLIINTFNINIFSFVSSYDNISWINRQSVIYLETGIWAKRQFIFFLMLIFSYIYGDFKDYYYLRMFRIAVIGVFLTIITNSIASSYRICDYFLFVFVILLYYSCKDLKFSLSKLPVVKWLVMLFIYFSQLILTFNIIGFI